MVVMRSAPRRARAAVAAAAEVVDAFSRSGQRGRQAGDAWRQSVDQPACEGAAWCVRVEQLNGLLLGCPTASAEYEHDEGKRCAQDNPAQTAAGRGGGQLVWAGGARHVTHPAPLVAPSGPASAPPLAEAAGPGHGVSGRPCR